MSKKKNLPSLKEKNSVVNKSTGEVLPRVKNQVSAYLYDKHYEKGSGISMTKPNQSMSIQEMVDRHRRGLPIDGARGPLFQGEDLRPNLDDMDLVDRANYIDSVADALVEVRARLDEAAKTTEQKKFLATVDEEVRKRLAEINANVKSEKKDDAD